MTTTTDRSPFQRHSRFAQIAAEMSYFQRQRREALEQLQAAVELYEARTASPLPSLPDGLPAQTEDRGSDSWCSRHGRIPWAMDGICGDCEAECGD